MAETNNLPNKVLMIVLVVLIIAVGAVLLDNIKSTDSVLTTSTAGNNATFTNTTICPESNCPESVAWNVTQEGLGGMDTFGDWIDIIVIMTVIAVVIGLIYGVFRYVGGAVGY